MDLTRRPIWIYFCMFSNEVIKGLIKDQINFKATKIM